MNEIPQTEVEKYLFSTFKNLTCVDYNEGLVFKEDSLFFKYCQWLEEDVIKYRKDSLRIDNLSINADNRFYISMSILSDDKKPKTNAKIFLDITQDSYVIKVVSKFEPVTQYLEYHSEDMLFDKYDHETKTAIKLINIYASALRKGSTSIAKNVFNFEKLHYTYVKEANKKGSYIYDKEDKVR